MTDMAKLELRYVQSYPDRHGKLRNYYRRPGYRRVPLPGEVGSAEFMAAYAEAAGQKVPDGVGQKRTKPKTINALLVAYYQSGGFKKKLSKGTQHSYRGMLEKFRAKHGDKSALTIQPVHINAILAEMGDTPAQASNLRKRLLSVFRLAVSLGWRNDNPVRETDRIEYKAKGFTPWSEDDIAQFRAYWGEGSREVLALTLLLCTGVRRSDVVSLGRQHIRGDAISVLQAKTDTRVTIPLHAELSAAIGRLGPCTTFILTQYGVPFTPDGFTQWFRERAELAGLKGRTPHGLRKAMGRRLAEAGCSEKQIAAVLGHSDPNTAKVYTKSADQDRLARDAMGKVGEEQERELSTRLDSLAKEA